MCDLIGTNSFKIASLLIRLGTNSFRSTRSTRFDSILIAVSTHWYYSIWLLSQHTVSLQVWQCTESFHSTRYQLGFIRYLLLSQHMLSLYVIRGTESFRNTLYHSRFESVLILWCTIICACCSFISIITYIITSIKSLLVGLVAIQEILSVSIWINSPRLQLYPWYPVWQTQKYPDSVWKQEPNWHGELSQASSQNKTEAK